MESTDIQENSRDYPVLRRGNNKIRVSFHAASSRAEKETETEKQNEREEGRILSKKKDEGSLHG